MTVCARHYSQEDMCIIGKEEEDIQGGPKNGTVFCIPHNFTKY